MGRVKDWYMDMMDDANEPEFNCYNCNPNDCLNYQARCYECEDFHGPILESEEFDLETLNAEWGPSATPSRPELDIEVEFPEEYELLLKLFGKK